MSFYNAVTGRRAVKDIVFVFHQALRQWFADNAQRMGAALAFYTVFSLSPLLILVIAVAGFLFGQSQAQGQIIAQIQSLIGEAGAQAVNVMIDAARQPAAGAVATIVGVVTLLIGATGALIELQDGLNRVWQAPDSGGVFSILRQRLVSLALNFGHRFFTARFPRGQHDSDRHRHAAPRPIPAASIVMA